MIDTRVFYFMVPASGVTDNRFTGLVVFHDDQFIREHGEGWTPVSHAVTPTNDGILLSVMANRKIKPPKL